MTNIVSATRPTNRSLVKSLKPDSEVLARIHGDFQQYLQRKSMENQRIRLMCYYEEVPSPGIGMVRPLILH